MIVQFDIPGFDAAMPAPIVEELHCYRSKTENGYDVECRIFGTSMGGLRIGAIDLPSILLALQEYTRCAWAARKNDIQVADFKATVQRGGNLQ